MGGYIAGSKELIDLLKCKAAGVLYHNSMSPIICQQVRTALRVIMGEDGTDIERQKSPLCEKTAITSERN